MCELGYLSWFVMQFKNKYLGSERFKTIISNQLKSWLSPALGIHVDSQVLEDVHVAAVGNAGHAGAVPLGPDELDRLGADVHHQCVDHRDVVAHAAVLGIQPCCSILQVGAKL